MAENTINDFNTLPEQVQLNKEDIETNTADITKLKNDIGKIKPNAWEERKFILNVDEESNADFTTYNPITDTNTPVNIQKAFTNKDTYSMTESVNSYSFFTSGSLSGANMSIYAICTDPSNTLYDLLGLDEQKESGVSILLVDRKDETGETQSSSLYINCTNIKTNGIKFNSMTIKDNDGNVKEINKITDNDDDSLNSLLTAFAINEYYLKKSDASNTYVTKTDASSTYVSKEDYDKRFEKAILTLTEAGFNKIKTMAEDEGTTIVLSPKSDFTEQVPPTNPRNMKEIKLYVGYDVENLYSNIHLMPNETTDDYDDLQGSFGKYWYTGHAMLSLPSQDYGYFVISYQKGVQLILRLIIHY